MKLISLTLIISVASLISSCDDSSTNNSSVSLDDLSEPTTQKAHTSKSKQPKTWPPASDEIASNLMTENYLVVLDDSGSMGGEKIIQAKQSLISLASILPPEHNLGLVLLNKEETIALQAGNREEFLHAIKASNADGSTPLQAATAKAYKAITKIASAQRGYGNYHMIIVTDGESSDGSPMPLVNEIVSKTAIQVHVIGFHLQDHEMNQPSFVDYRTAANSSELTHAFKAVTAEAEEFSDPKEFSR